MLGRERPHAPAYRADVRRCDAAGDGEVRHRRRAPPASCRIPPRIRPVGELAERASGLTTTPYGRPPDGAPRTPPVTGSDEEPPRPAAHALVLPQREPDDGVASELAAFAHERDEPLALAPALLDALVDLAEPGLVEGDLSGSGVRDPHRVIVAHIGLAGCHEVADMTAGGFCPAAATWNCVQPGRASRTRTRAAVRTIGRQGSRSGRVRARRVSVRPHAVSGPRCGG